jgi:hypothetical protein
MTARQVHSVIAAGIDDPALLDRWRDDPSTLREHGLDPAAVDLDALRKFAGLAVKVRHNGLREHLPLTFRLMNVAGLEIEIFSAYAMTRRHYAPATEQRTLDLMAFLDGFLDRDRRDHAMLWDLIRHEHALSSAAAPGGAKVLLEMQCDPREVAAALFQSRPPLDDIALDARYFCYSGEQLVELDAFGFYAISLAEETRSAGEISEAMGAGRPPSAAFMQLLGQLRDAGLLEFEEP